jgi:Lipid A 3-O-deacylase (PagL)
MLWAGSSFHDRIAVLYKAPGDRMKPAAFASLVVLLVLASAANAQIGDEPNFGSKNTYSVFLEYSNDSSHILLGQAPDRKFASLGVQYERRLISNHLLVWRYAAEFRPLVLVSDPTADMTVTVNAPPPSMTFIESPVVAMRCIAGQNAFSGTNPDTGIFYSYTVLTSCGQRWTYALGLSPAGTRINLLPHRRLQPTASFLAGYMLSAKTIPIDSAGSFNFTFEFGAGLEYYQSPSRSIRFEYQIQHFSNAYTATDNPGVDSGLLKLTYNFGR